MDARAEIGTGEAAQPGEWRRGWPIVFSGSVGVGLGYGLLLTTAGLFVIPMQEELGWSRGATMVAPIVGLATAPLSPIAGAAIDRYGARPLAILGLCLMIGGFLAMALLPITPILFYATLGLFAAAASLSGPLIYCKAVATWFTRHAGLAFGITMSGMPVAAAITIPIVSAVIERSGWRAGYLTLAGMIAVVGIPIVIWLFREREAAPGPSAATAGTGSLGEAFRDPRFWMLLAAFAFASMAVGGYLSQLNPIVRGSGFTAAAAASAMSVYVISIGIGRIASGFLLDRFHPPMVAGACLALAAIGALLLTMVGPANPSLALVFVAAFLLGWGQGAEGDYMAFFTRYLFGTRQFGLIFGVFGLVVGGGIALGGLLFAASFDLTGNYQLAQYSGAAGYFAAALLMLGIRVRKEGE